MSLKEFELFHGVVLTKLIRRDKPVTLCLIETNTLEFWSIYTVNDVIFFLKHSTNPRELQNGGRSWSFQFTENQLKQIKEKTCIVLVCGSKDTKDKDMEICFIKDEEVKTLLSNEAKSLTVRIQPGQKIRVSSSAVDKDKKVLVSRNALEKYEISS